MAAGVRTAGSAVISAAESIAARVRSLLHFSVPDEGPLADADTYMPDFMELLAKGITKNEKLVTDAVSQLAGAMGTNLSGPVGNLGGSVEAAFEKITIAIRDSLKSAAGGIEEGLLAGLSGAKDKVGSLWGELADITRGAMDSLTNEVKQGMSGVASAIGELSNQMTSLGSGLSNLGNTIGSKFLVSVGNGVTKVGSIVGSVAGITEDLFEMSQSIQTITGAFQNLDTALSGVAGSSGSLGELGELFQTLISRCGGLGDALSGLLSNLGSAGSSGLSGLLSNLGSGIGKTLTGLVSKVGSFGSGLSGIISSIGSTLSGIAGSAGSTITGLLGSAGSAIGGFAASAGTALSGVAASAGGLLASAGGALAGLAGPAGIAVAAVGAVGVGIKSLWDNCDSFREGVTNIWDKVTVAVTSGVNAVKGAISTAASAIANGVSAVWSGVKSAASAAVNWGKDICSGIANGIKSAASGVFSAVKNVARRICKMDDQNNLTEVVETKNIVKTATGAEADGVAVDVNSLVSMNMWGLTPDFLDVLEKGFKEFFEKEVPGNPQKAEYLIPIFIGELLEQGKMSVKVLKTNDTWYGMTYHEDVAAVKGSFKEMLENSVYKADLFSDL